MSEPDAGMPSPVAASFLYEPVSGYCWTRKSVMLFPWDRHKGNCRNQQDGRGEQSVTCHGVPLGWAFQRRGTCEGLVPAPSSDSPAIEQILWAAPCRRGQ